MRSSGILMPIFSLPSPYGIGTLGKEAFEFVDFLKKAGQTYWQILPLNPTNYGDSPYQSFSADAGNPYLIDLDLLAEEGLLSPEEYAGVDFGSNPEHVDYGKMYENRFRILRDAFARFDRNQEEYGRFCRKERRWLDDYALFMAIKDAQNGVSWHFWEEGLKFRKPSALRRFREAHEEEIAFYRFLQFEFYRQWFNLKSYANRNGIFLIGDMPIYVADDSVDVWCNTNQFDLDEALLPRTVAGCPPDAFSKDGQLWGMPVYDWEAMKSDSTPYRWWRKRVKHACSVYDVVRIDHFRGFASFYCIRYGASNAKHGKWKKGPGMDLFRYIAKDLGGKMPIVAEDLGILTPDVKALLKESGLPGMKVLQFAFDPDAESDYLPHNLPKNCIVYTGTHDNDTILGWEASAKEEEVQFARKYLHIGNEDREGLNWAMMRAALMSVADTAILMMPDLISLGSEGRINTPSTLGTQNWSWRIRKECLNDWLAGIIRENTALYGRLRKEKKTGSARA